MLELLLTVVAAYFLADFLTGVFHWFEQRYGQADWWLLGPLVVEPNQRHHQWPGRIARLGFWERNWTTFLGAWPFALIGLWLGSPLLFWTAVFSSLSNEIHSWAHCKASWPIRWLQKVGLFQSPQHHAVHHRRPYLSNYCVMSAYLNGPLSYLNFWRGMEWGIEALTGIRPNPDREVF